MENFIEIIKNNGFEIEEVNFTSNFGINDFMLQDKMILFFDLENDYRLRNFLDYCYDEDVQAYSKHGAKYILLHRQNLEFDSKEIIEYFIPQLKSFGNFDNEILRLTSNLNLYKKGHGYQDFANTYHSLYREILLNNGYNGNIKSGFIFKSFSSIYVLGFNYENFFSNLKTPLELIVDSFKNEIILNSRHNFDPKVIVYEQLDEETKAKVQAIESQLEELKDNGKLLFVLPVLKKLMVQQAEKLDLDRISTIFINSEYQIKLPYFNNLEVKMSNLTKAVYILFYENPDGIDLQELPKYREQLRRIYFDICPFDDVDKMNQSINDIVDINTKAIYTHISRIKSSFQKVVDYEVAKHYIVKSNYHGDSFKFIPIIKQKENPIDRSDLDDLAMQAF
jgi:hypothetical protein